MTRPRIIKTIKVACFAALFVYLFIHVSYVFRDDLANTREHMAGFYGEEKNELDVVIMGTSSTFSAFMPMQLWESNGITSYVMTTNVQMENSLPYTIREMKKYQNPKLLVIDTAPFLYKHRPENTEETVLRYNVDGFKYSKNRIDLINHVVPEDKLYYYLDLLYYHDSYHPNLKYWNIPKHSFAKGYSNLHPECSLSWDIEVNDIDMASDADSFEDIYMGTEDIDNWNDLLDELKNYDGEVLFVIGPVFRINDEWAGRIAAMRQMVEKSGYQLFDMSTSDEKEAIGINPEVDYSLDQIHYNSLSASKITARLGEYLQDNYSLTDHRIDTASSVYKRWSSDLEKWKEALPEMDAETNRLREEYNIQNGISN